MSRLHLIWRGLAGGTERDKPTTGGTGVRPSEPAKPYPPRLTRLTSRCDNCGRLGVLYPRRVQMTLTGGIQGTARFLFCHECATNFDRYWPQASADE